MTEKKLETLAETFNLLASEVKLKILLALDDGSKSVKELTEIVRGRASQSSVSQHLKLFRWKRIVKSERRGSYILYSLTGEGKRIVSIVKEIAGVIK